MTQTDSVDLLSTCAGNVLDKFVHWE